MERKQVIRAIVFGAVGAILAILLMRKCGTGVDINNINSLNDSLTIYKNKYGQEVAKTSLITNLSIKELLSVQSNDSAIIKLQQEIRKYKDKLGKGSSVTTIYNSTEISDTTFTRIVEGLASKIRVSGDTVYIYPTYQCSDSSRWRSYSLQAGADSCIIKFSVENEYSVVIGEERPNWYKAKVPFVEVTNKNPYTKTKTLKSYQVEYKDKTRFNIGVGAGAALTPKGVQPAVYVGLNYTLIKL